MFRDRIAKRVLNFVLHNLNRRTGIPLFGGVHYPYLNHYFVFVYYYTRVMHSR